MTDEGEQIRKLYRAYWRCMIDRDVQGLRRMMTEDYTLQHMTGVRQSADAFLRGLQDGTFRYFSAGHDGIEVTVEGDRAILVGKSRVLAAVYGGGPRLWRLRGDFTLRKERDGWKLSGSKASVY